MRIADLYADNRPIFSFEFFPPHSVKAAAELLETIRDLSRLSPDFVSVTCPIVKERRPLTFGLIARIKHEVDIEAMAHLVTTGYSRKEARGVLEGLRIGGVENVLALRGDSPLDVDTAEPQEFPHASDLASFAHELGLCVGGAAHPEMHPDSPDWDSEIRHARIKVEAGCEFLVTQLFFDNTDYFRYVERMRDAGISVPIIPGIMPITSLKGIQRIAELNGNRIPEDLLRELEAVRDDSAAVHRLGVRHATSQCVELLQKGAAGIHFYTLNRSPATRQILDKLGVKLGA
jgi:methylenetetrahydrofolate reductase (NADPH)